MSTKRRSSAPSMSTRWRYRLEGQDHGQSGWSYAYEDRIDEIRRLASKWRKLKWTKTVQIRDTRTGRLVK